MEGEAELLQCALGMPTCINASTGNIHALQCMGSK